MNELKVGMTAMVHNLKEHPNLNCVFVKLLQFVKAGDICERPDRPEIHLHNTNPEDVWVCSGPIPNGWGAFLPKNLMAANFDIGRENHSPLQSLYDDYEAMFTEVVFVWIHTMANSKKSMTGNWHEFRRQISLYAGGLLHINGLNVRAMFERSFCTAASEGAINQFPLPKVVRCWVIDTDQGYRLVCKYKKPKRRNPNFKPRVAITPPAKPIRPADHFSWLEPIEVGGIIELVERNTDPLQERHPFKNMGITDVDLTKAYPERG